MFGLTPAYVDRLRARLARAIGITTAGSCTSTVLALRYHPTKDPMVEIPAQSLQGYHDFWTAINDTEKEKLRAAWPELVRQQSPPSWAKVRGPIAAYIATLHQVGWRAILPDMLVDRTGH